MKYLLIIYSLISVLSCEQKASQSIEPLKIEAIDDIPYLMTQMKLDSVFEIVTFGKYGTAKVSDTLNYYRLIDKNVVSQKLKSFMCCTYTYVYDTLGLLTIRTQFSDYSEYSTSTYKRNEDHIFETKKSNMSTTINYSYDIKNELLVAKIGESNSKTAFIEASTFEYNIKKQLAVKSSKTNNNDPDSGINYSKIITTYSWVENHLNKTNEKAYFPNDMGYFETITAFDSDGFPASKIIKKNMDVICKTIIERY
ncbi:hypothetical protein [Winogradskyella sp.]|uniref:hypothetical protein n=1 Tax=Winogradskyella sp. TaxID=1883156 RepID=UPI0025EFA1EE|nr:hypothetical protein [Winogradskyella sp.]